MMPWRSKSTEFLYCLLNYWPSPFNRQVADTSAVLLYKQTKPLVKQVSMNSLDRSTISSMSSTSL